ncbi:MAG: alpha/beta fold hydrolase, partial [Steroidobacteraceae bacterium]
ATDTHLIAPDFPGFGHSDAPPPSSYTYTFDQLAKTIDAFLEKLKIDKYTLYLHDYGAPVCFRIMLMHPERVHALIIQNGNIYEDGLGSKWKKIAEYWADPEAHPEVVNAFLSFEATEQRHTAGTSHPERYNPDTWTDEYAHLSKPGQREIQAALLYDYRTNVASYPKWQAWLKASHRVLPGMRAAMLIDGRAVYRRRYLRDGYEDEIDGKAERWSRRHIWAAAA